MSEESEEWYDNPEIESMVTEYQELESELKSVKEKIKKAIEYLHSDMDKYIIIKLLQEADND